MRLLDPTIREFDHQRRLFQWAVPQNLNIAEQVCDRHAGHSGQIALYYENQQGDTQTYTFGQIRRLSNCFANVLEHKGVRAGDRVAIILPQRPETALAHLACYKIGAVALPLSILFGPDALQYRLQDSGAVMAITHSSRLETLQAMHADLPQLKHIISCGGDRPGDFWNLLQRASDGYTCRATRASDPALLIYTSGTTGPPKGALIAHRSLLGNLTGFELSQNFFPQAADVFWTPADWAWTGGLWDALLPTWYYAKPILAYEGGKFDPEKACHLINKYQIKNAFIPPTALKMMRQVPDLRTRYGGLQMRSIMSAGEAVGEELIHWGQQNLDLTINEMWGQTEFNYLVGNCSAIMAVRPGSMGKPYPGHHVDIIDDDGQVMPTGQTGEIAARRGDPVMFLGYWKNDSATQNKFIGDWFCTGDVGYRDDDGYLWFVGRKDDVISSAGYRIGPGEIEDCLLKHPSVQQAAVIGKPDDLRGTIVKAFIVLAPGQIADRALKQDIQKMIKERLAAYEYPREIEFLDELPMTTTGKVRRIELRQREMGKTPIKPISPG